jgi:murein DD-endopeptidase MepM/ murein hydrolase activator NlpD
VQDFRGKGFTYDSHNGTDFAVAPGTLVVAPAAGRVLRISSEFDRGGLKVFIDHGDGFMTTSNHLARALVQVGQTVKRGEPIALSGYSGIDGLLTFPFGTPHVHFNVWLNGDYVDPFARTGETALWRTGNLPTPAPAAELEVDKGEAAPIDTEFAVNALQTCLDACTDAATRTAIEGEPDPARCVMAAIFYQNYYPSRFRTRTQFVAAPYPRAPRLDLPFSVEDFDGVVFPDERVGFVLR